MPNRLSLLRQRPPIFDKIGKSRGPLAFLDESFRTASEDQDSFYILCAVVVDKKEVIELRRELRNLAGSARWHTTEVGRSDEGRQKIRQMARLIASFSTVVIALSSQLQEKDRGGELARSILTKTLLDELAQNHLYMTGTVVFEKRVPGEMRARDEALFSQISRGESPASKLSFWGLASKNEPLLWAPDVVAWCFRQAYYKQDESFFQDLEKCTTVIKL